MKVNFQEKQSRQYQHYLGNQAILKLQRNQHHQIENMNEQQKITMDIPATVVEQQHYIASVARLNSDTFSAQSRIKFKGLKNGHWHKIKTMKIGRSSQECTICIEPFERGQIIKKLPCGHIIHKNCIKNWFKRDSRCPLCRLDLKDLFSKE